MHRLSEVDDLQAFLDENADEILNETTEGYLNGLLQIKGLKAADAAQRSGQGDYVYKVLQGTRKAGRNILIAIAVGVGLTVPETQLLLRIAQTAQLDPRNRRDSVVIYALNNTLAIEKTNEILYDLDENTF